MFLELILKKNENEERAIMTSVIKGGTDGEWVGWQWMPDVSSEPANIRPISHTSIVVALGGEHFWHKARLSPREGWQFEKAGCRCVAPNIRLISHTSIVGRDIFQQLLDNRYHIAI